MCFRLSLSNSKAGKMRGKRENIVKMVEDQVKEDTDALAEKTGLLPWQVLLIASIIILSLVGVTIFCLYRFCAKKRAKKGESKKNIDEQKLVDGEEEIDILEEEVIKVNVYIVKTPTQLQRNL